MKTKTLLNRTWIGVKMGLTTPTLSKEMLDFQRKPFIRIIIIIGGISCLSLLGQAHIKLEGIFLKFAIFFTLIFYIYHIYILLNRYRHIKYLIKSGSLDYRNSPLNK